MFGSYMRAVAAKSPLVHVFGTLGFYYDGATLFIGSTEAHVMNETPTATVDAPIKLTPSELAVLVRMVEGDTNDQIATALGISTHTAKFHVNHVTKKLGHTTRTGAAVRAVRLGLVA